MTITSDARPLIVHLIDELPPDGAERLIVDVLRYPNPNFRYAVGCLVRGGVLESELRDLGIPVIVFGRKDRFDVGFVFRLAAWMRRERVAVVHTHLFTADTYGRIAAKLAGVRAVFATVHNVVNPWKGFVRKTIDWLLAWPSTRVIACSDEVGTVLVKRDRLPARRIVTIRNGVDLRRFRDVSGAGVREEFGIAQGTTLLAVIGRLHPQKGHADLLPALAKLRAAGAAPFACLIIGDGELRASLEAQAHALGLGESVVFTGLRRDVPRLLAAIDVLVMPSRWEGLPIALLEAMACARGAVATAVGGVPDVIAHDVNGLLVPPADPDAMADALLRLLADPALRQRLGARARADVLERYDVARTACEYDALYRGALGLGADHALRVVGAEHA